MAGEPNQALWRGIRPTDPAENIPVDVKVHTVSTPIIPADPEKIFTRYEVPEGATYVDAYDSVTNDIVMVYTVPDNTEFFLTSLDFTIFTNANARGWVAIRNAADTVVAYIYNVTVLANSGFGASAQYPIARKIPEKYDIGIRSFDAGLGAFAHIVGYTRPT